MFEVSTTEILFLTFDLLFDFWPLIFLRALEGRGKVLPKLLVVWGFFVVGRVLLIFSPEPITASFLIPEPLNTTLFFVTGIVLLTIQFGVNARQRGKIRRKANKARSTEELLDLSPREFEEMIVELYRIRGHRAKRTGSTGDHGVDVVVQAKNGEKWIAQCKRWRGTVGEPVIRDFYGVMHHEKADMGAVFTTGRFSGRAQKWAKGKPIYLCDGNELLKLWKRARARK